MNNDEMVKGRDIDGDDLDDDISDELDDEDEDLDESFDIDTDDDTVAGMSAEINVEELVAKFEAADSDDIERKRAIKRRLEQIAEERDIDLDSTYNFNLDDDDF